MTKLTWTETPHGPTEMWVEGRTARDYESQGFVMVDYKPPPPGWIGCCSGSVLIRKPGSEGINVSSPELCALHQHVCSTFDNGTAGLALRGSIRNRLREAHSELFGEMKYHEELMHVERFDEETPLEVPQGRIVAAFRLLAEASKGGAKKLLEKMADAIEKWKFKTKEI